MYRQKNPVSCAEILVNRASRVSMKSGFPVKISCIFLNSAPYFVQILDPKSTLSDPVMSPNTSDKLFYMRDLKIYCFCLLYG